jgi:nitrate/nitrite-specific signal transduction histidine kinase
LLSAVALTEDKTSPIQQLGWTLVIHQDESASLAPVEAQTRATILLSLVIVALGSAGAVLTARVLATPILNLTKTAEQVAAGNLTAQAPITTGDEIGQLTQTFNSMTAQLRQTVVGLEERVAERTRALALSAELSRRLSGLLDQQQLIVEVVEQVRSTFNYYHTHIYLLDAKAEQLVMAGGTGEAARTMLARGHRIEAGRGLVGRAAKTNTAVLVANVHQDPVWLANPLLPGTQAEVAVPIAIGGRVLGVLDVQHQNIDGLSEADVQILQTIANQVAIALQNAQSYEQARNQVERETFINALNQKIQRAASIPDVLEIAARELGQILNAQRTVAQINNPDRAGGAALKG